MEFKFPASPLSACLLWLLWVEGYRGAVPPGCAMPGAGVPGAPPGGIPGAPALGMGSTVIAGALDGGAAELQPARRGTASTKRDTAFFNNIEGP